MDRTIRTFTSWREADDAEADYYASLTPTERVNILLELVAQYRSSLGPSGDGFERVYRITRLTDA
jgi:hypothetical protein